MTMDDNKEIPTIQYPSQGHGKWNIAVARDLLQRVESSSSSSKQQPQRWEYGTAGFRYPQEVLKPIMVRMGWLAVARCAAEQTNNNGMMIHVGMMITASHNAEQDNGLKLADPSDGGMLHSDWEINAVTLANATTSVLEQWWNKQQQQKHRAVVHVGMDTRWHSPMLAQLAVRAALSAGAIVIHHGYVTTPQLHYMVQHANSSNLPSLLPVRPGLLGYYNSLLSSYLQLLSTAANTSSRSTQNRFLTVDCACGVGGWKARQLQSYLQRYVQDYYPTNDDDDDDNNHLAVQFQLVNVPGDGPLNDKCGAEYVQKQQLPFQIYNSTNNKTTTKYMCSFDGDADRIVFSYFDHQNKFQLLDGDKIAVLVSKFIQQELQYLLQHVTPTTTSIKCGVVQTAYANGSSTHYLKVRLSPYIHIYVYMCV